MDASSITKITLPLYNSNSIPTGQVLEPHVLVQNSRSALTHNKEATIGAVDYGPQWRDGVGFAANLNSMSCQNLHLLERRNRHLPSQSLQQLLDVR